MWRGILQVAVGVLAVGGLLGLGFTWSFRTKYRPVQDVIRRLNRSVTNPRQLRSAGRPGAYASVIHHVGRASGAAYRTPIVAVPAEDGFLIALPYGRGVDWARNIVAAGSATIEHEGETHVVGRPRFFTADEANRHFPAKEQRTHRRFGVRDFLHLSA